MKKRKINFKKGLSLLEVLFVLGILTILLGMIFIIQAHVSARIKSNSLIQEVLAIRNAEDTLFSSTGAGFASDQHFGLSSTDLAKTGLISKEYIHDGDLMTPFGSSITIDNSSPGHYIIWLWSVPYESCVAFTQQNWDNLYQFGIGYENLFSGGSNSSPSDKKWSPEDAESACNAKGNQSTWIAIGFWAR